MGAGHTKQYHDSDDDDNDSAGEKVTLDMSLFTDNMPTIDKSEIFGILRDYGISITTHIFHIIVQDMEKACIALANKFEDVTLPIIAKETSAFTNWSESQRFPSLICYPRNKHDLVKILKHPGFMGNKIGLLGSTYSSENMFGHSETILINFLHFNAFGEDEEKRAIIVDKKNCIVSISAGCSILEKHGALGILKDPMLLPSSVIFTDGQYTGISATGSHGCSFTEGSVSDRIRKITFLDAEGKENVLDIDKDEKKLRAGAIGLGSYGIITELQFKMERETLVVTESHYWTLSQMKYHLHNRPSDWISFEHYWWPFGSVSLSDAFQCLKTGRLTNYDYEQDKVYCRIVRYYRDPYDKKYPYFEKYSKSYIYPDEPHNIFPELKGRKDYTYYFQEVLVWLRKYFFMEYEDKVDPRLKIIPERITPLGHVLILKLLKQLQFWSEFGKPKISTYFNAVHYLPMVSALPARLNNVELCFKASSKTADPSVERESYDNYFRALNELGVRIQDEAYYGRFPVNLCVESRICGSSPCPLAPCYSTQSKKFCFLDIISSIHTPSWKHFGNEFFQVIKSIDPNVKPSLGKQWVHIDGIYDHIREVCKEGLAELKELQQEYDKDGRFMTPAITKLFED
ncbi:hypothetical protein LOD99_3323 [Oopsacas minuta]|uniref:FAD-binding PCMH-type domain-containing protein n=1 Tax=Oopsacas minuta TaxID=111878 RepID=A0AAV7JYC8_9METZ|nr:hypothetical protein LOD99_3323 [Oopsacas minuta]